MNANNKPNNCPCKNQLNQSNSCVNRCLNRTITQPVILFSTTENNILYEVKYNVARCELILVITNPCDQRQTESVLISSGYDESPCIKCEKGQKGETGETGSKGDRGRKGDRGEDGVDGRNGCDGIDGQDGSKGAKGEIGCKGDKGQDGNSFRFVGAYNPCRIYHYGDVVRFNGTKLYGLDINELTGLFIYTATIESIPVPSSTNINDAIGWELMLKDGRSDNIRENKIPNELPNEMPKNNNIIESFTKNSLDWSNFNKITYDPDMSFSELSEQSELQLNKLLPIDNIKINDYYYGSIMTDIQYSLSMPKKQKWSVPIIFEKMIVTGPTFDNMKNQIIIKKAGTYKVTIHINFMGTKFFKTSAYLLKPTDNPLDDTYQKDRKIKSSKMSITNPKKNKNHLHYCFIVKVYDLLSTLVIMSEHKTAKTKTTDDEIIIFGREKTWILVEKIV